MTSKVLGTGCAYGCVVYISHRYFAKKKKKVTAGYFSFPYLLFLFSYLFSAEGGWVVGRD